MTVTYTPEQRAEAVALYSEVGPSEVERRLGIPKGTVTRWGQEAGVETVPCEKNRASIEARKVNLAEGLLDDAERLREALFGSMTVFHFDRDGGFHDATLDVPTTGDQKNIMTSIAIAIDKLQLLSGSATARTETVNSSDIDREIETLLAKMGERERASD